jgi:hypothetical protein
VGTKLKKGPADQLTTWDNLIRSALECDLRAQFQSDPETIILDELGLRHGAARVDIVVVNGNLIGFELKSDRDDLRRLPKQARGVKRALSSALRFPKASHSACFHRRIGT